MQNDTRLIRWAITTVVFSMSLLYACTVENPLRSPEIDASVADALAPDVADVADAILADAAEPDSHPPIILSQLPCIAFNPQDGLDMGEVEVGGTGESDGLYVESCGGNTRLDALGMAQGSHPAVTLLAESIPHFPVVLPGIEEGQPPPRRRFKVVCKPTEVGTFTGFAQILSGDLTHPVLGVAVTCTGVEPGTGPDAGRNPTACPTPAVVASQVEATLLDVVVLDGSPSRDDDGPRGRPVKYTWQMIDSPPGSSAHPVERPGNDPQAPQDGASEDDPLTPTARLVVDAPGIYTIQLIVTDNQDQVAPSENCPEPVATVTINATVGPGIVVLMSWHTPGDDDVTDTMGSDVDLHLRHPRAERWSTQLDCYYANPNPDWGMIAHAAGDPLLALDDINGAGPELITFPDPEDTSALGGTYRVGVDYYRQESLSSFTGYGPSYVSVWIYLAGELAWANEVPKELLATHDFWEVAEIEWTADVYRVRPVDRVTPGPGN